MKQVNVSIIILTKNAGENFSNALSSIYSQNYKNFEVIIIDSGSTDNTLEIAKLYPTKIIKIKPEEFGHGKTRNLGAKLARGKYVVYLTHDAIPENKSWLLQLIKPLRNKKIVGVYSRQIPKNGEKILDKFFYLSLYSNQDKIWNDGDYMQGNNIFSNVSSVIKKEILKKYPFDNNIIVSEDYEWAQRILKANYSLYYNPKSRVIHSHSYNIVSLFKRCFDIGVSYMKVYRTESQFGSFIKKGLKIHSYEIKFLIKHKKAHLIFNCIIRDFIKYVAVTLGKRSSHLPNSINKIFSNYPRYWR